MGRGKNRDKEKDKLANRARRKSWREERVGGKR